MSTTELRWPDVMADAIEKFSGQTCRQADEQTILRHFQRNPMMVIRAIDDIAAANVTWYWSALAARLERSGASANVSVNVGPSREQAAAKAEAWLRNAGMHFDRWDETHDELFGDRGPLRAWKNDQTLVARMRTAWQTARPTGEAIDHETEERARAWRERDRRARHATRPAALRLAPPPAFVALANGQPAAPAPEPVVGRARAPEPSPEGATA